MVAHEHPEPDAEARGERRGAHHGDGMSAPRRGVGRVIGLDIGTRRIGVAVSDELGLIAVPERVITVAQTPSGEGDAIAEIVAYGQRIDAVRIVAGIPRNMKGERGVQAEWTEAFIARLRRELQSIHIPLATLDERWSTTLAERYDHERPNWLLDDQWGTVRERRDKQDQVNRRKRRGADRDQIDARAAAVILQGYLDRQRARSARDVDDSTSGA
jgi:putative Holliday junction resolvase